jgi:hypothetical protein
MQPHKSQILHESLVDTANDPSDAGTAHSSTRVSMTNVCSEHSRIVSLGARPDVVQRLTIEVMVHTSPLDVNFESMV